MRKTVAEMPALGKRRALDGPPFACWPPLSWALSRGTVFAWRSGMRCAILRPVSAMKSWLLILIVCLGFAAPARPAPSLFDPSLRVEAVVADLTLPTTMAFIAADDFFVLQKNDGRVFRVQSGAATEVLNLIVDNASEHGLLGTRCIRNSTATASFIFTTRRRARAPTAVTPPSPTASTNSTGTAAR